MRTPLLVLFASSAALAACSSDQPAPGVGSNAPGPLGLCHPDPALATQRDACGFASGAMPSATIGNCTGKSIPIEHIVVLMQENRSFDQYFGHLPGHGLDDVDVPATPPSNPAADGSAAIPWHKETAYCVEDTDHGWVASHQQWNNGANDGFAMSNATTGDPSGQRALGFYDQTDIPFYYSLIPMFATSDRYFSSLLGPTYPNRMYFFAATSFGIVRTVVSQLAPPASPMVMRELDAKGVTWKAYTTNLPSLFLFPDYSNAMGSRIVAASAFATDAAAGTLPQVSILDSGFSESANVETDEHPPADIQLGQHYVWQQIEALMKSPLWSSSVLFLTYDEHGGLYDHVSPPAACVPDGTAPVQNPELGGFDRLGFRVPLIVVSPWAKRHFVSHTVHSHTSILRFIQTKFDLPALTGRDANSDALLDLFDFDNAPDLTVPALAEPPVDQTQLTACSTFP